MEGFDGGERGHGLEEKEVRIGLDGLVV
jgi:hypothetical protein